MEFSTAVVFCLALLGFWYWKKSRPNKFPPGPLALPIIGNLLQLSFSSFAKDLQKLSEAYGPVYSIYLGVTPAVVVRGFKSLKEVLVTQGTEFADRPQNRITNLISINKGLVAAAYGLSWKEHRRFTLSTLRTFGLGKKSMQEKILEESQNLIHEFKNHKDSLLVPHFILDNAVSNIICSIVLGRRYDYNDSTLRNVLKYVHENMKLVSSIWAQLYNTFGFIHYLPLPHRKILQNTEIIFKFLRSILEEHKKTRVPGEPRDIIDYYLEELNKEQAEGSSKTTFSQESLLYCVTDLFVAGTETTSASLQWCLLYMIMFPEIQEKCREEIDRVLGTRDHLDYEDRENMAYTQAVMQEVQRFASVVPLGVPHATIKDVQLNDFTIPKGTLIITDLSSVHYDETHWKYPHEFNPENFLNEDGELLKTEYFLPFSAGPRVCLGENLARMEIFLFFTAMLQHFEFYLPDPMCPPDLSPVFGLTQAPKQFKIKLVPRKQA